MKLIWISIPALIVMVLSSGLLVNKLINLAKYYKLSGSFMGLTVLSLGTSIPEIASHLIASAGILNGNLDYKITSSTILGANIGSDVVQQTLVLGLVIFAMGSVTFTRSFLRDSYSVMIGTTLLTWLLAFDGTISRLDGAILFSCFLLYMYYLYSQETKEEKEEQEDIEINPLNEILMVLGSLTVLLICSTIVLLAVEELVSVTGFGGSFIGVITIGVASALPEMSTALQGLHRKSMGISLGTLIGSNITNPLLAIGLGGMTSTYFVPSGLIFWDLPMETISAMLLLIWLYFNKFKLKRGGAIYLICLYFFYLLIRFIYFGDN